MRNCEKYKSFLKNQKNPIKPKKNNKTQKNPPRLGLKKKPGFFSTLKLTIIDLRKTFRVPTSGSNLWRKQNN